MSSRVLSVFFKVGHIFGITPGSLQVPKISPLKKLYYILIFLIPTQCLLTRVILNSHTHIRENKILYAFNGICFIGHDFTLLLRNFQNRKSWVSFLQNLKTTARILPKTTSKHSFYCGFFFMNFVYLVTTILVLYIYTHAHPNFLKQFYGEFFHSYYDLLNKFLSFVTIKMILTRYQNLRKMLHVYFGQTKRIRLDVLKNIQYTVRSLKVTVDGYNDLFGWTVLFNISHSLVSLLGITGYVLARKGQLGLFGFVMTNLIQIVLFLVFFSFQK